MRRNVTVYADFRGGLNTDAAPDLLNDNELSVADNVLLDRRGGFRKRFGTAKVNQESFGQEVKRVIPWPREDGSESSIVLIGTTLYERFENGTLKEIGTSNSLLSNFVFKNQFYYIDDTGFKRYDGEVSRPIIPETPTAPNVTASFFPNSAHNLYHTTTGNGKCTEDSSYDTRVTFVINGVETIGGPVVSVYLGWGDNAIEWGNIPNGPPGTTAKRLYRSTSMGSTLYLEAEIAPSVTNYISELSDTMLQQRPVKPGNPFDVGNYRGRVTFIDAQGVESEWSEISNTATLISGQQLFWTIPTGPEYVTKRRLYRTKNNGDVFYLAAEINDNETVEYSDVKPNGSLGAPYAFEDRDMTPILRCKHIYWSPLNFRCYAAGDPEDPTALYYSEPNAPHYWKAESRIYPTQTDGPVTALTAFSGAILVFYEHSIWRLTGTAPTNFTWAKLPVSQGTTSPRSIALTSNSLTFLGQGGLYAISPAILDLPVTFAPGEELVANLTRNRVSTIIQSITNRQNVCGLWDRHSERYYLFYSDTEDEQNNKALVLDWGLRAFTRFTGWRVNDAVTTSSGELLLCSKNWLLKSDPTSANDIEVESGNEQPIDMLVTTKQYSLGAPFHEKKTAKLLIATRQYDEEESSVSINVQSAYKTLDFPDVSLEESIKPGGTWAAVGGWSDLITKELRCSLKGLRFQVSFKNAVISQPVTIYGLAFTHLIRRPKGVKVL